MRAVFLVLLLPFLSQAQPGFLIDFYGTTQQDVANIRDVVVDDDTIVVAMTTFDANNHIGMKFMKLDTFGTVLAEAMYSDSFVILSTLWNGLKLLNTEDGGYAVSGVSYGGIVYLLKVKHDLSLDFLTWYYPDTTTAMTTYLYSQSLVEVDDGFVIVGTIWSLISGVYKDDPLILKTDKSGKELWRKQYGSFERKCGIFDIQYFDSNTYVVSGRYSSNVPIMGHRVLFAIDSLGVKKWEWNSDILYGRGVNDFLMLPDSSWLFATGTWRQNPAGSYGTEPILMRLDKDFNIMWERVDGGVLAKGQFWRSLKLAPDGDYLASGWLFDKADTIRKIVHYKFTADNDSLWMRWDTVFSRDGPYLNESLLNGTDFLSSGSIISVGAANKYTPGLGGGEYAFVMKLSPEGCMDTIGCWPVANQVFLGEAGAIQVYPNPVNEELTVFLPDDFNQKMYIHFYDVGRFLYKKRVWAGRNMLSISDLQKGMIFYTIFSEKGILKNGKLIVEN